MSFKKDHIVVDRTNYEEYFLLLIDGELTTEQSNQVNSFLALHPDLRLELDLLLATKLTGETLFFENKQSLLSQNMQASIIDESLLLYIDNELPATEINKIQQRIKEDAAYSLQYNQLQSAQLDKTETVIFPYKKSLYRTPEKIVRHLFWMRTAIAGVLLLSISILWLVNNGGSNTPPVTVVVTPANKGGTQETEIKINTDRTIGTEQNRNFSPLPETNKLLSPVKVETPIVTLNTSPSKRTSVKNIYKVIKPKEETGNEVFVSTDLAAQTTNQDVKKINSIVAPSQQQIINAPSVTTQTIPSYTTIDASAVTDAGVSFAIAAVNDKKGSIRGLLRKATRFIERRTGINPVNEDDQLLIGVVAIKL